MTQASLRQFSATRLSNVDLGGGTVQENQMYPSGVNNAFRELMGQLYEYNMQEMSYPTAGGTANALTLTPTTALAALASNVVYTFKAASVNTGAATLNVSGLGAKAIRKIGGGTDNDVIGGDLLLGGRYTVVYDAAANSAAGAWVIVNPAPIVSVRRQLFIANGTYTPSAGMAYCTVECQGGGGGGGGAAINSAGGFNGGGGGGSGSYSSQVTSSATVGASQVVTVGAAGAAGTAGNNAGGNGGATSVGSICTATGGTGGGGAANGGNGAAGAAGAAGTGNPAINGQAGGPGLSATIITYLGPSGGQGGSSFFGGGGQTITPSGPGSAASGYGAGGGGGSSYNGGSAQAGGMGSQGLVVITEYCTV